MVNEFRNVMWNVIFGEIWDKFYLKEYIEVILEYDYGFNEKNIDLVILFN